MSDADCGHDVRFGAVFDLPKSDRGCLACTVERLAAENAALRNKQYHHQGDLREIESLRSRLADSLRAEEYVGLQRDKAERSLTWLWTHCRAIGMTKQAEASPDVHQFAMDIALFTADLEAERALIVQRAENAEAALVEAGKELDFAVAGLAVVERRRDELKARLAEAEALLRCCDDTFSDLLNTLDHDEDCPWWDEVRDTPEKEAFPACGCWKRGVEIMRSNVREVLSWQASIDAHLARKP